MIKLSLISFIFFCGTLLSTVLASGASNNGLVYSGRVLGPDGIPLQESGVKFTVRIYGSSNNTVTDISNPAAPSVSVGVPDRCLLFDELHVVDMTGSMGAFELLIGSGTPQGASASWSTIANRIFVNSSSPQHFINAVSCDTGVAYQPGSAEKNRELVVSIETSETTINLAAQTIQSVPYANQAAAVGGYPANNLLRVADSRPSSVFTGSGFDLLHAISNLGVLNGTATTAGAYVHFAADVLRVGDNPSDGLSVVNKNYVDTAVFNLGTGDITGINAGDGLTGGGITGDVTLNVVGGAGMVVSSNSVAVDVGLGASKIPQVGGAALAANGLVVVNGLGTALTSLNCGIDEIVRFSATGLAECGVDTAGSLVAFEQNGNSFGAKAMLGTNDNNDLGFETNGTEKMTILANGNVGIGTTSPAGGLHLYLNSAAFYDRPGHGAFGGSHFLLRSSAGSFATPTASGLTGNWLGTFRFAGHDGTNFTTTGPAIKGSASQNWTGAALGSELSFYTIANDTNTEAERMRIRENGNVGIGNVDASTRLDVSGAINLRNMAAPAVAPANQGRIYFDTTANKFKISENGGAYTDLVIPGADNLGNHTAIQNISLGSYWLSGDGGNEGLSVTSSGNVGVGTDSPSQKFVVSGGNAIINTVNVGLGAGSSTNSVALGTDALIANTSGTHNSAIGWKALNANTTGSYNTALGESALILNTTGQFNTAIGQSTLTKILTGSRNTAVGSGVLFNATGSDNSGLGSFSLINLTSGANNTGLGNFALNGTTTGNNNVAVGRNALANNIVGSDNTAVGRGAIEASTGSNNIGIGIQVADNMTAGNNNIFIGNFIDAPNATGSHQIVIGNLIYGTGADGTNTSISGGSVGIGVSSPAAKLDVAGAVLSRPVGTGAGQTGQVVMRELAVNGSNTVALRAPDAIASDLAFTLPSADGSSGQFLSTNGSGALTWASALTTTNGFVNGGNSFGAAASLGTNDNFALGLETNGTEKMTILTNGNVGIGTNNPGSILEVVLPDNGTQNGVIFNGQRTAAGGHAVRLELRAPNSPVSANNKNFQIVNFNGSSGTENMLQFASVNDDGTAKSRMVFSHSGKLGVGTDNPVAKLEVTDSAPFIRIQESGSGGDKRLEMGVTSGGVGWVGANQSAQDLAFQTVGTEKVRITSTGLVGIGTISPLGGLHVAGNGGIGTITIDRFGGGAHIPMRSANGTQSAPTVIQSDDILSRLSGAGYHGSGYNVGGYIDIKAEENFSATNAGSYFSFVTREPGSSAGLVEKMRISGSGNVGIGKSNPLAKLDVDGYIQSNPASGHALLDLKINGNNRVSVYNDAGSPGTLAFDTQGGATTQKMVIKPEGNVGIGNLTPSAMLDVNGQIRPSMGTPLVNPSSNEVDFKTGNTQYVTITTCPGNVLTVNLYSMLEGGSYSVVVIVPSGCLVSFTGNSAPVGVSGGTAVTSFKYPAGQVFTSTGNPMVYSMIRANNFVFVAQVVDFQ